jgi:3-oxoacyl-(acyl-carrier-protein) synthase/enoyl-CoA hydratase/carnithine racemase/NADP-dependent 3-hydroxy acid dehydrogenase YdfG
MGADRKDELLLKSRELISKLKKENKALKGSDEPIAIIGMACRFPEADDLDQFWANLVSGKDCISEIPKERFSLDQYLKSDRGHEKFSSTPKGGFISDADLFDNTFFKVSIQEALFMDPQQRILLETTWHALEDAGINPRSLRDTATGCFVGISSADYFKLIVRNFEPHQIAAYTATGNSSSTAAGRLSFFFGLQGPTFAVDTACSSSLVALDVACKSLKSGETDACIVAGVNLMLSAELTVNFAEAGMLAPDGHCKTFDKSADGYVRAEGCGVVVLRRLSEAVKNGDAIYAVIKGSAVNHGGEAAGLTVPNGIAQENLIRKALTQASVEPSDISYIEAHGTGTSLGDPIEMNALSTLFSGRAKDNPLYIGSVKTNMGHLEAAAGVASLIKTALSMHHDSIPPHLHLKEIHPLIDLPSMNGCIPSALLPWDAEHKYAGISSFGFSGTNAHVVLEEAPSLEKAPSDGRALFVLSAAKESSLKILVKDYIDFLGSSEERLQDICYTAALGREHFRHRLVLIAESKKDLIDQLQTVSVIDTGASAVECISTPDSLEEAMEQYLGGASIDWRGVFTADGGAYRKVHQPLYRFDRKRFWIEINRTQSARQENMVSQVKSKPTEPPLYADKQYLHQIVANQNQTGPGATGNVIFSEYQWESIDEKGVPDGAFDYPIDEKAIQQALKETVSVVFSRDKKKGCLLIALDAHASDLVEKRVSTIIDAIKTSGESTLEVLCLLARSDELSLFHSVTAFLRVLYAESSIAGAVVASMDRQLFADQNVLKAMGSFLGDGIRAVRYDNGQYFEQRQRRISPAIERSKLLKEGGTYLITGGLKGVGALISEHLAREFSANLVLLGRSALEEEQELQVKRLEQLGGKCGYYQADVTDEQSIERAFGEIDKQHSGIDGVFHAAGVIKDALFENKDVADFLRVLAPKVKGSILLDQYTKDRNLDFFVLFSSIAASIGNPGQSDYAFANGFLADFAEYRNNCLQKGEKCGRTIAIEWPYWSEGGMRASQAMIALSKQELGLLPLPTSLGIEALKAIDSMDGGRTVVYYGLEEKIERQLLGDRKTAPKESRSDEKLSEGIDLDVLKAELALLISDIAKEIIGSEDEHIDLDQPLTNYGIDSIGKTELAGRLVGHMSFLDPRSLIQQDTITDIVSDVVEKHIGDISFLLEDRTGDESESYSGEIGSAMTENLKGFIGSLLPLQDLSILPTDLQKRLAALSRVKLFIDADQSIWLFLHNEPANLFDYETVHDLCEALKIANDPFFAFSKVLFFSHFTEYFSLGGDRMLFMEFLNSKDGKEVDRYVSLVKEIYGLIKEDKLYIAVVDGTAQGGGFEFLLNTDLQFVRTHVQMGTPEVLSGLFAGMGGISYLSSVVSSSLFHRLGFLGELISSEEAIENRIITNLSENPFADASGYVRSLPDIDLAIRINAMASSDKKRLIAQDLDAWAAYIKSGEMLKGRSKILSDYSTFLSDDTV